MGILVYTALYNYFATMYPPPLHTTKGAPAPTLSRGPSAVLLLGQDIYDSLGEYFKDSARKWLLGAPLDDSALVPYLLPSTTPSSCSPSIVF